MHYQKIRINRTKTMDLHRHKMEAHLGKNLSFNECVHHIDGNKHNNSIENLEVVTRSIHSSLHMSGRSLPMSTVEKLRNASRASRPGAKISIDTVKQIKIDLANGIRGYILSRKYGVSKGIIYQIKNGRTWSWVNNEEVAGE